MCICAGIPPLIETQAGIAVGSVALVALVIAGVLVAVKQRPELARCLFNERDDATNLVL